MSKSDTIICIPARYASTRFPGKPIVKLAGKPIIQWVYERAKKSKADDVIIATDNKQIQMCAETFNAKCVMTSPNHPSGTDRIWEAVKNIECDIVINVQGDEPLIDIQLIDRLIDLFDNNKVEMATVVLNADRKIIASNPNIVKAVVAQNGRALYFSRSEVPFIRDIDDSFPIYHHVGIYGYRKNILEKIVNLPPSPLEKCEKLEQLRALENGINIYAIIAENRINIGIDTPEDLKHAEKVVNQMGIS